MRVEIRDLLAVGRPARRQVEASASSSSRIFRGSPRPSESRTCSSYSPLSSEKYAIHLPSGDQAGSRSITPVVVGQVARVALFGRHGEDLAARLEQRAGAGRRDVRVGQPPRDVDELRPQLGDVAGERDLHRRQRAGLEVVELDLPELLDDDARRGRRRPT